MATTTPNTVVQQVNHKHAVLNTKIEVAKVVVVGSLHWDFINIVDTLQRHHVQANESVEASGGHGANQAVACARLSTLPPASTIRKVLGADEPFESGPAMEVFMKGVIGDQDNFGTRIVSELRKNGVNTNGVFTIQGEYTGYAHINVDALGANSVTGTAKANAKCLLGPALKLDMVPYAVLVQLEIPQQTVKNVLAWAKKHNAITICNAAPVMRTIAEEIFQVDHLILNEEQADKRAGIEINLFPDRSGQRSEIRSHYLEQCDKFHKLGAKSVVITMADLGAVGSSMDYGVTRRYLFDAKQADKRRVEDTTGCSDAFIGAYAVEIVHQKQLNLKQDIGLAMEMGIKASGLCVSRVGSMAGIPTVKEMLTTKFRAVDV